MMKTIVFECDEHGEVARLDEVLYRHLTRSAACPRTPGPRAPALSLFDVGMVA